MLNTVVAIVGSIGVAGSLLLVAWQTRELASQTRINTATSSLANYYNTLERLHSIMLVIVHDPELRAYFFDNRPCPPGDPRRAQVMTIGEMLADTFDYALTRPHFDPSENEHDGWQPSSRDFVVNSPMARELLRDHPTYWPSLYKLCRRSITESGDGERPAA